MSSTWLQGIMLNNFLINFSCQTRSNAWATSRNTATQNSPFSRASSMVLVILCNCSIVECFSRKPNCESIMSFFSLNYFVQALDVQLLKKLAYNWQQGNWPIRRRVRWRLIWLKQNYNFSLFPLSWNIFQPDNCVEYLYQLHDGLMR